MTVLTREDIRQTECPQCGASPGVMCRYGKLRKAKNHFMRMQAAQEASGSNVTRKVREDGSWRQTVPAKAGRRTLKESDRTQLRELALDPQVTPDGLRFAVLIILGESAPAARRLLGITRSLYLST